VRAVIDYRPALRDRTGVGEYTHELVAALVRLAPESALEVSVFSSSWKDRLAVAPELAGAAAIDRRIPVGLLNFAWHRLGWPTAETIMGRQFDVTHSLHPLILPSRQAAHVVTIHDLAFVTHPERTRAEIRRDYAALARSHAGRADHIIVPSRFTACEVERRFGVAAGKITVCSPGAPKWRPREAPPQQGYILFLGTLEPRKNIGGLLDAYECLVRAATVSHTTSKLPELVLAGKAIAESDVWLERIGREPLRGAVRHVGYVEPSQRRGLFENAVLLVQPSFEEGFGMPVLEAMSAGVPVVAANRGALPEVLGDAGLLVDPDRPEELASAMARFIDDPPFAVAAAARGGARAARFDWDTTARLVHKAYTRAIEHRRCASA
jgi:glycosyltransferase involved in cell wall biosynthesis